MESNPRNDDFVCISYTFFAKGTEIMRQFCPQESEGSKSLTYENKAREQKLTFIDF